METNGICHSPVKQYEFYMLMEHISIKNNTRCTIVSINRIHWEKYVKYPLKGHEFIHILFKKIWGTVC